MSRPTLQAYLSLAALVLCTCTASADTPEDPRLAQTVTVREVGTPLSDLLAGLVAKTGVKMSARKDAADDKLAVFVKDMPLSDLQEAVRKVLHLQITRETGKDRQFHYEFWMDARTKKEIEARKQDEVRQLKRRVEELAAKSERAGAGRPGVGTKPDESAQDESDEDWTAEYERTAFLGYRRLTPRQIADLWAGDRVVLDLKDADADTREKFLESLPEFLRGKESDSETEIIRTDSVTRATFELVLDEEENRPMLLVTVYLAQTTRNPVLDMDIPVEFGWPEKLTLPDDESWWWAIENALDEQGDETVATAPVHMPGEYGEKAPNPYHVMEEIADQADMDIVSDYFTFLSTRRIPEEALKKKDDEARLKLAADVLCSDLTAEDKTRRLASRLWYRNRDREIPARLVKRWKEAAEKNDGYRLQDAFEMAQLSTLQLKDFRIYALGNGDDIRSCRHALRLSGTLTASQWQAAVSENGLPVAEMSPSQFDIVREWAEADDSFGKHPPEDPRIPTDEILRRRAFLIQEPMGRFSSYGFAVSEEEGDDLSSAFFLFALSDSWRSPEWYKEKEVGGKQ